MSATPWKGKARLPNIFDGGCDEKKVEDQDLTIVRIDLRHSSNLCRSTRKAHRTRLDQKTEVRRNLLRVGLIFGPDHDIDINGEAREAMNTEGNPAANGVFDTTLHKRIAQAEQLLIKIEHPA